MAHEGATEDPTIPPEPVVPAEPEPSAASDADGSTSEERTD